MSQATKDLLEAIGIVILAMAILVLGGILWMHYPEAMRIFFAILGCGSMLVLSVCLAYIGIALNRS
jgi:hypothetical protein